MHKIIRTADLEDSIGINNLVNSAYRGETSKVGWTTEADLLGGQRSDPEEIREIISDPKQAILLYVQEQNIIGTVVVRNLNERGYIGMLTVKPDLQQAGIGKELLSAAEDYIHRHWGLTNIEMTVIKQRVELINWYLRRGYNLTNEYRPFPYDDPRFGLPKVKGIEFVVLNKRLV